MTTERRTGLEPGRRLRHLLRLQLVRITENGRVDTTAYSEALAWRIRVSGKTQREIAEEVGTTKATVEGWSQKRFLPSSVFLPALALALECSIEELYLLPEEAPRL